MFVCGGRIPGARISDFGFILVFLVSLIASMAILMGMKLAFEEDEVNREKGETVIMVTRHTA